MSETLGGILAIQVIALLWIYYLLVIVVGVIAHHKGKAGMGWGIYAFFLLPIALPHVFVTAPNDKIITARQIERGRRPCPHCGEFILPHVTVCRACGRNVPQEEDMPALLRQAWQNAYRP